MCLDKAIRFAKEYASLGDAVAEQVDDLIAGRSQDVMPEAAKLMQSRLSGFYPELDRLLDNYKPTEEN